MYTHKNGDKILVLINLLDISDGRKAVVFVFQQIFKDMKEEDQHTKIPSPHRTLSLNPPLPLHQLCDPCDRAIFAPWASF